MTKKVIFFFIEKEKKHVIERVEELVQALIKKKIIVLKLYRKIAWDF